jgi:hypothetical protein
MARDEATRAEQRRRWRAIAAQARALEAAAGRLQAELEVRVWLHDFARALARSAEQLAARWRWN